MTSYNLYAQAAPGSTFAGTDVASYTMGVQFSVSVSGATCDGIWFYSITGATALPGSVALYTTVPALVTSDTATWLSGPGGSAAAAASGWCYAAFTSPPVLTSGTAYQGCIFLNNVVAGTRFSPTRRTISPAGRGRPGSPAGRGVRTVKRRCGARAERL